ncbi:type VI secretion system protein IglI family protein [Archangium lansingense]|uniref:type VI secretion system protein IglI family protein n=1 Tax=Archangium lansingense TaxID=2995310 RepID=UPI003B81924E
MSETTPALLDLTYLEPSTAQPPDAESTEDRLERLTALVNQGNYPQAASEAEALLGEGVRDVRLVHPYLFGAFLEHGLHALPSLFAFLSKLLTSQWETFGPEDKKTVYLQSGLRSLFKTLYRHLEFHARSKDETWHQWCAPDNREPLQDALMLEPEVVEALGRTLPGSGCEPQLKQLVTWLESHLSALPHAPEPHEEDPAEEDAPEHDEEEFEEEPPKAAPPRTSAAPQAPAAGPSIPISPALALLIRKLDAFDMLVERKDLARASVVAADVLHTLDHFDPRLYLPTLFSRFFSGLSTYADSVERLLQSTDSLAFRSLEQLYRVDLNAFLAQQGGEPLE